MPPRARALPPDERRAAILTAVLPVVLDKGMSASTRELAQAAGVAEGTLFRVFDSKDDLILAAAKSVFARTDHLDHLAAIDPGLPLEARLLDVVRIWQGSMRRIVGVFVTFHADRDRMGDLRGLLDHSIAARTHEVVARLLAPDAEHLRLPPQEVVAIMGALTMASVHPSHAQVPMTPEQIVDVLLHGVLGTAPAAVLTVTQREATHSSRGIPR